MGRGHLAYYQAMARRGEIKSVHGLSDLEEAVEVWKEPKTDTPIYHILVDGECRSHHRSR